jgi:hypothetical protein
MRDLLRKTFVSLSMSAAFVFCLISSVTYAQEARNVLGQGPVSLAGEKKKKIDSPVLAGAGSIAYGDSVLGTLTDGDPRSRLWPDPGWVGTSGRPADTYSISGNSGDTIWLQIDK